MNKKIITFEANEQSLIKTGGISNYSSNKVSYIEAEFELGENWQGFDAVRAIWYNKSEIIATVLSDGHCTVPYEVLTDKGQVKVNLVGSISENDVLTDRLTSYPVVAFIVDAEAKVNGSNTQPITPSQFEQFVEAVKTDADRAEQGASDAETYANNAETSADNALLYSQNAEGSAIRASGYALDAQGYAQNAENYASDAEDARDEIRNMSANATTLPAGSSATASYSDGVLSLGIPQGIQGEKGDNGDTGATPNLTIGTVETLEPTQDAYVTRRGTDDNPIFDFGIPKGDTGEVTMSQLSSLLPTDTASGDIASFPDGTDLFSALSVKAQIEPIQSGSGTPSPTNVRPISGRTEVVTQRTGKNLFDNSLYYIGYASQLWENGAQGETVHKTATGCTIATTINYGFGVYLGRFDIGTTMTVSFSQNGISSGSNVSIRKTATNELSSAYGISATLLATKTIQNGYNSITFTTDKDCHYWLGFYDGQTAARHEQTLTDIQLELGSTATDYEPYQGTSYTTTLGRTVYGGEVEQVSGSLTDKMAMVDLGTLTWQKYGTYSDMDRYISAGIDSTAKDGETNAICSIYPLKWGANGFVIGGGSAKLSVLTELGQYSSVADFKTAMNGVQLCYELATPQTYQLDPTEVDLLLGQNNLWTDCGSVEVTYKADVGLYIDKKLG